MYLYGPALKLRKNIRPRYIKLSKSHSAFKQIRHKSITVLCTQVVTVASPIAGRVNALCLHAVSIASGGAAVSHSVILPCITLLHTSRGGRTCIATFEEPVYKMPFYISQTKNSVSTNNQSVKVAKKSNRWVHFENRRHCVGKMQRFQHSNYRMWKWAVLQP